MSSKKTEQYKTDLYYDSIAQAIETLLLDEHFAFASDQELSKALEARAIPADRATIGRVRRERGIGTKWQREFVKAQSSKGTA